MKKVVLLALALASGGLLMSQTVTSYPYTENFDTFPFDNSSFAPGAEPNPLVNDWVNDTTDVATQDWYGRSSATGSSNTGPSADHTGGGRYMFVEDGFGNHNDVGLISPLFDLNSATNPAMSVWVHSRTSSSTSNSMFVQIWTSSSNTWTQIDSIGTLSNTDTWFEMTYDLSSYSSDSVRIAFVVDNSTTSFQHDIAIDDFSIFNTSFTASASNLGNNSCSNDASGSAAASWSFNNGPVSVLWSNGATTDTISGLADGSYIVTITDSAGTSVVDTVSISSMFAAPVFTTSSVNETCGGAADGTAQVDSVTMFTGSANRPCGDTSSASVDTTVSTISAVDTGSISNSSTGYPALFGNWYWGSRHQLLYRANELTAAGFSAGYFTSIQIPVTQVNGTNDYLNYAVSLACTSDSTLSGGYVTGLTEVSFDDTITIDTGMVQIDFHTPYYWDGTSNIVLQTCFNNTGYTNNSVTPQTNVGYTAVRYYRADIANVCSNTTSTTGTSNNRPNVTFRQDAALPFSPVTYAWSNGATTQSITGLSAGTYTVTITDQACSATQSVVVSASSLSLSTTVNSNATSCNPGSGTASLAGGVAPYTYAWSTGGTGATVSLPVGAHTVTATDANGCFETGTVTITGPASAFAVIPNHTDITCNGSMNGTASVTASGGTAPYTYSWSNGATTASLSGLSAGTYTASVSDAAGCSSTNTFVITEPSQLIAFVSSNSNPLCNGDVTGAVGITALGGTGAYTYAWSNGSTMSSLSNVTAGAYTVTVTDANGCTISVNHTITQPNPIVSAFANTNDPSCNGTVDGTATAVAVGGTSPLTYSWSNGVTTAANTSLATGDSYVTITDANGCTLVDTVTLTEPAVLTVTLGSQTNVACFGGNDGSATISATGGTAPYSYNWTSGSTGSTANNLMAGTYSVIVTDVNGCSATTSATITEPASGLAIALTENDALCAGSSDGSISASVSGGTAGYTYAWSNGASTSSNSGLTAGSYDVTVTDANGCTMIATGVVGEPMPISASLYSEDVNCFGDSTGVATAMGGVTGGTAPYTFNWSNGSTADTISGLVAGNYDVTITDANGCTAISSVTVNENAALDVQLMVSNAACEGGNDGAITANVTGGFGNYNYVWSTSDSTSNINGLVEGAYDVTVTDGLGCTQTASGTVDFDNLNPVVDLGPDVAVGPGTQTISSGFPNASNLWSTGETSETITPTISTDSTFWVVVATNEGCTGTDTISFEILLSADSPEDNSTIKLYPNPTNGQLNVKIENLNAQELAIQVLDFTGKIIMERNWDRPSNLFNEQIDLSDQSQGVYFVNIITDGHTHTERITVY